MKFYTFFTTLLGCIICSSAIYAQAIQPNNSPYYFLGDYTKTLNATFEAKTPIAFSMKGRLHDGTIVNVIFDYKEHIISVTDSIGQIIAIDTLAPESIAFSSIDPHAENYHQFSPYSYCADNPINAIDPNGMDWYRNNETMHYTWYDGNADRDGFTHIGGKGSVLGEFETIIDNILSGEDGLGLESLYSEGFTFDISPIDKGALIGSEERGWDFFDEFVFGTGPEFSVLLESHPYTQAIMAESAITEYQRVITSRGKNGKYTNVGRSGFFPWQAGPANPMQFIGTYRYDGYSSLDGNHINNVVTDSKSVTSLGYHIPFLNNHRRSKKSEFGNTYQFYIWQSKK